MVPFSFCSRVMHLVEGRALYWPDEEALLVADLHLEKGSFFARHGQMLPPYDSRETLERLARAIRLTGARRVIALGDNFHDSRGEERMEPFAAGMLSALTRSVDWTWITGNHDPRMEALAGGTLARELELGGIRLRHKAIKGAPDPEISGHFHPKLTVLARGRRISRACGVLATGMGSGGAGGGGEDGADSCGRLILPAFGALTGGMSASDPAILAAMQPAGRIDAIVPAAGRLVQYPLWRAAA